MQTPTDEQNNAIDKFRSMKSLKITAYAGAGKTSTLVYLAQTRKSRGVYLAFNKSIAAEASEKFPKNIDCRTTHSVAWRTIQSSHRFSTAKMKDRIGAKQLASALSLSDLVFPGYMRLTGTQFSHLILGTLRRYCQSSDDHIGSSHVPDYGRLIGAPREVVEEIKSKALSESRNVWQRMINNSDRMPLGHDGYLKLWALSRPDFEADFVLLDEAQDTNPVVLGVMSSQQCQIVLVGDKHQQIYEWRGAINAMESVSTIEHAHLTQSFRFGDEIAAAATRVLFSLGETIPIRGNSNIISKITTSHTPTTVLSRTNASVILEALEAIQAGKRVFVVGGIEELKVLLNDVFELKQGRPGVSPDFFGFQNWNDVISFADSEEGQSIRTFVQLVSKYGENVLWSAVSNAHSDERTADLIVSTAHKAKGREWDSVRLTPDFFSTKLVKGNPQAEAEVRLFYVAMTRAKRHLSVDQKVLASFLSGSWKERTRESSAPKNEDGKKPNVNRGPIELTRTSAQSRHPAWASVDTTKSPNSENFSSFHESRSKSGLKSTFSDRVSDDVRSRHPSAIGTISKDGKESFWKRITRIIRTR